ncbi:hypothetical protein [Polaribacter sp.]|uniref:hypothetical protein n=1 Tax=Polaribacter sp. TaxID=1920175 RepID=UPI003EF9FAD1
MRKNTFIFIFCFLSFNSFSQKLELTKEDKEEFKRRTVRMIELFKESLKIIPTFNAEPLLKDKAISNVLRMFVKNAKIEIAIASQPKKPISKKIGTYLHSLTNYEAKRELVHIDIIDFTVEDIKPHPTQLGSYSMKYTFVQRFYKKKNYINTSIPGEEKLETIEWDYVDDTTKSGEAIVKKVSTRNGTKWMMLLGDIKVNDIKVLTK